MFKSFVKSNFYLLLLTFFLVVVAFLNFRPETWLTGWDTLHPEFDYSLNLKRLFSGVWREEQGLGALAAHAHMSDLPRVFVLIVLDLFLPTKSVKYIFNLLCLVLGPFGIFFLVRFLLKNKSKTQVRDSAALIGSLFYLFNLATVQHFHVVFEMFAVQYAAIGWLFLFGLKYLDQGSKKQFLLLASVSLLASPMAYASVLWFAFFMGLSLTVCFLLILRQTNLKRSLALILILFLTNSFWLFPNLYYLYSGGAEIPKRSHANSLFSPEAYLHTKSYGNLPDVAIFKNFLFHWTVFSNDQDKFVLLLDDWQKHLSYPGILWIGYFYAILGLIGIFLTIIKGKKNLIIFLPAWLVSFIFLANNFWFLPIIFDKLRSFSSTFREALRFPFTKFSIIYLMITSLFIGFAIYCLLEQIKSYLVRRFLLVLLILSLVIYSWPMFQGKLISDKMKLDIPQAYFRLFSWSKLQQKDARIAYFPVGSSAGWEYHDWGYEGAGFTWFGLQQPILVRDFDRWQPANETFYNQISTAFFRRDKKEFLDALEKYKVKYVLLDHSLFNPTNSKQSLGQDTEVFLKSLKMRLVFEEDFLEVYQIEQPESNSQRIPAKLVKEKSTYARLDPAYSLLGNYIGAPLDEAGYFYPFSSLYLQKVTSTDLNIEVQDQKASLYKSFSLSKPQDWTLKPLVSTLIKSRQIYPYTVEFNKKEIQLSVKFPLEIILNGKTVLPLFKWKRTILADEVDDVLIKTNFNSWILEQGEKKTGFANLDFGQKFNFEFLSINGKRSLGVIELEPFWFDLNRHLNFNHVFKDKENKLKVIYSLQDYKQIKPKSVDVLNCDSLERGRTFVEKQQAEHRLYLADELGAICEVFYLIGLDNKSNYFFRIDQENIYGRGLKIYLSNMANRQNVLTSLLNSSKPQIYSVIDWPLLEEASYTLHVENRSFGGKSRNFLQDLLFFPFPLDFIANIKIEKQDGFKPTTLALTPRDSGFFETRGIGFLSNGQASSKGWIAFSLRGGFLSKHAGDFNSWSNVWQVSEEKDNVVIIFWPQLLEFIGFGLIFTSVGYFSYQIISSIRAKKN